jgi:hypothetical protein
MRRSPYTLLVSLVFCALTIEAAHAADFINVVMQPQANEDNLPSWATDADTDEIPSFRPASVGPQHGPGASLPAFSPKPVTKCKVPTCMPASFCPPAASPGCVLPKRMFRQWEFATQVFFARVRGTVRQGSYLGGAVPATNIDLNNDLGVPEHGVFLEYSGRYQFAPSWAVFYSIMPIELEANKTLERDLYFRESQLPFGTRVHTKWDLTYQRLGLLYQPIVNCNATVSIFGGWTYSDQLVHLYNYVCHGRAATVTRTRNMVTSGIEIQKCITTKCTGATLSCDNRVGLSYLDGSFGLDVQAGLRFSVPMGGNRWGYARGGYRYLSLTEDRNDFRLDAILEGGFAEAGLIF